jgi:hypothetical protein
LLSLSGADRRLLFRAMTALVTVRVALSLVPMDRLRRWAADARVPDERQPIERIAWAVSAASRRVPGATCLVSALALQRLLSRDGHPSVLHIGVAKREQRFAAHAWVEVEGRTLIGEVEDNDYARLVAWRVDGRVGGRIDRSSGTG